MLPIAGDRRLPSAAMEPTRPVTGDPERCPRCGSHDTKFCYYNNYNLAQPRHFCKACRRYWTLGGSLRNVPIGGSTRSGTTSTTAPHHHKQPHRSSASAPSSKRRRASADPSSTSAMPSPSSLSSSPLTSLALDAHSVAPISAAAPKLEPANIVEPASMDLAGNFVSLLTEPLHGGLLALGDHFLHGRDDDFELGLGFGGGPKWVTDEIGFSTPRPAPAWPFFTEDDGAGPVGAGGAAAAVMNGERDAWTMAAKGAELVGGDCGGYFGWPELAMATTSGKVL